MSSCPGISAFPQENDIFTWVGTIEGAEGTVSFKAFRSYQLSKLHTTCSTTME